MEGNALESFKVGMLSVAPLPKGTDKVNLYRIRGTVLVSALKEGCSLGMTALPFELFKLIILKAEGEPT